MIEGFKSWISALLCIGIFVSVLELILPKSKIKKYIYILVGIVTTITIISPAINLLKQDDIAQSVSSVLNNFNSSSNSNNNVNLDEYKTNQENLLKDEFVNSLQKDIQSKLTLRGIGVTQVKVTINDNYDIQKIEVKTTKLTDTPLKEVSKVAEYINSEYDVDFSKIEVIESGD